MKFIEVAGKKLKLASRRTRLYALFIDGLLLASILLPKSFWFCSHAFRFFPTWIAPVHYVDIRTANCLALVVAQLGLLVFFLDGR